MRWILTFLLFTLPFSLSSKNNFYYFPDNKDDWNFDTYLGLSLTRLPMVVVEEEINQSPLLELGFRLSSPFNLSLLSEYKSNYLSNVGTLNLLYHFFNGKLKAGLGFNCMGWFGHLDIEGINLKSRGLTFIPYISIAYDFEDFLLTFNLERHSNLIWTQSDNIELGRITSDYSGLAFNFYIEQPLWKDNNVILGVKLNYLKFYYQSWIAYNTIDEILLYPEFKFAIIL